MYMPSAGFGLSIPAIRRLQTDATDHTITGVGKRKDVSRVVFRIVDELNGK